MNISYPEVGVCGLSCRLCPMYQSESASKCGGCKSQARMAVGCPFITCAVKKKGIEFCWLCAESSTCEKWRKHRDTGKEHDSFKCYQKLEDDIAHIREHGVDQFVQQQKVREMVLREMLRGFNDGRSKSYYCVAATVLQVDELQDCLQKAREQSAGLPLPDQAKLMHALLESVSKSKGYLLRLRK